MRARDEEKANTLYNKKNSIKEMIPHEKKTEDKKPLQDEWEWGAWIATVVIKHLHTHIDHQHRRWAPLAIKRRKKNICYTAKLVDAIAVSKAKKSPLITEKSIRRERVRANWRGREGKWTTFGIVCKTIEKR